MSHLDKWMSLASLPKQEPSGRWVDQANGVAFDENVDYFTHPLWKSYAASLFKYDLSKLEAVLSYRRAHQKQTAACVEFARAIAAKRGYALRDVALEFDLELDRDESSTQEDWPAPNN